MLLDNNTPIDMIAPHSVTNENGPFGKAFQETKGFSATEWSSIPPIVWEMRGTTVGEMNILVEKALKWLLLECDFQLLTLQQKQVVSILRFGYKWNDYYNRTIYDCTEEALSNWLNESNIKYWSRLNWTQIAKTFKKHDSEFLAEKKEWAEQAGIELPENWEYITPKPQWFYMSHTYNEYIGAMWTVSYLD